MNLMPFVNLLAAKGLGKAGSTLFINMMPAECEAGILLRNPLTGSPIDYELPGRFDTSFQVIVRGHSYADCETLITKAIDLLTISMDGTVVDNMTFTYCRPRTEPMSYPLSRGNLLEFNVWFDCVFVKETA